MGEFLLNLVIFALQLLGWHYIFEISWMFSTIIAAVVQLILFALFRSGAPGAALEILGDIFD